MDEDKEIITMEENKEEIKKYFLKNNYTKLFSALILISLFFTIIKISKISVLGNFIQSVSGMFSLTMWILLIVALGISTALAYLNKLKWIVLPIFIWLLILTVQVRTANMSGLIDTTTGEQTLGPDLDPFLYLRNVYEITNGNVPTIDLMRYVPLGAGNYAKSSLMPWAILGVYKIISIFSDATIIYSAIIAPVIFFILSLIGFFLFSKNIFSFNMNKTKASLVALIGSFFYAFSPQMLHRTTGGIPEIESLGMAFFWFAFLFFTLAWKTENRNKQIIYGIIAGLFTGVMSWSWGGYRYIYMIISLTALILFFFGKDLKKNLIIFSSWLIPSIMIEFLKTKSMTSIIGNISVTGFALGVFSLILLCVILKKLQLEKKINKLKIPSSINVILIAVILGILFLLLIDPKLIIKIPSQIIEGLLYPFGRGRTGLTVAENKAPYLTDALQQMGYLFWGFLISTLILFYESIKHFEKKNKRILFVSFLIFICCLAFTRISPSSVFNGDNFISHLIYLIGFAIFIFTILNIYIKAYRKNENSTLENFKKIDVTYILLISFSFWALVSMRGAIRLFFIVSPMIILLGSALPLKLWEYRKNKDDLLKIMAIGILILSIIAFSYSFVQHYQATSSEAKATIPGIYEQQWQRAMKWVRENTPENSVFVHWWDYGYWVQTLGERPTVTDGGHFIGYWDHLTGRYLLTTSFPEVALSFMKSHNVNYLLIDSTDLGKYSAYSSIGSDVSGDDRLSWISVMLSDSKQTKETQNGTTIVYQGGTATDEDIIYKLDNKDIFLPGKKTALMGVIVKTTNSKEGIYFNRPEAVFYYNNQQTSIPVRYIYVKGKLIDFEDGLDAVVEIIPSYDGSKINEYGASIYLTKRVKDSLFAQMYLMNDPLNKYPTIKLAYSENDILVNYMKSNGFDIGEFVYYGGFRGPIKIWKVDYPKNTVEREEFLRTSGDYGELDNLTVTK